MSNGISGPDMSYLLSKAGSATDAQKAELLAALSNTTTAASKTADVSSASQTNEDALQTVSFEETTPTLEVQGNSEVEKVGEAYDRQISKAERQIAEMNRQLKQLDSKREQLLCQLGGPDVDISGIVSELNNISTSKNDLFFEIMNMNFDIGDMKIQKNLDIESILSNEQNIAALSGAGYDTGTMMNLMGMGSGINVNADVGTYAAQLGQSFVGVVNSDYEGNKRFSPNGASQAWCADFVTTVTRNAWKAKGKQVPSGFGSSAVVGLQGWGQQKGVYLDTASSQNNVARASAIARNVKPGDIMIQQRNGASHTGLVTKVYPDGSFDTVEGNSSNAVKNNHYDASSAKLSGFVLMSRVA